MSSPIRPESMEPSNDIGKVVDVLAGEAEEQGSLGDLFGERKKLLRAMRTLTRRSLRQR